MDKETLKKIEIGAIVAVLVAIVSGVFVAGRFDGRLSSIENNLDYREFVKLRDDALEQISVAKNDAIAELRNLENPEIRFFNIGRTASQELGEFAFCALSKVQNDFETVVGNTHQWVERKNNGIWFYRSDGQRPDSGGVVCII